MTFVHSDPPNSRSAPNILRFLADNNPFYILSACCMLFGVFAINNSLAWSPIPLPNVLRMIVTLNIYEVLLIAMAVLLMRRGIRRDGMMLILIEAFFLADVGFLNMEVFVLRMDIGLLVNGLLLLAAGIKAAFLLRAAGARIWNRQFAFICIQIAILMAAPGFLACMARPHDDHLSPLALYAAWWAAGLLPAGYALFVRNFAPFHRRRFVDPAQRTPLLVLRLLLILPLLSLIAHLSLAHWIYNVAFHPLNAAPLLLGLALALGHADQFSIAIGRRMRLQLLLPVLAVFLSAAHFPDDMLFTFAGVTLSPLRLALGAAAIVYLDGLLMHRRLLFAAGALSCMILTTLGPTRAAINTHGHRLSRSAWSWVGQLIPRSLSEWGIVSIAAAFVLLAVGLLFSLRHRPHQPSTNDLTIR